MLTMESEYHNEVTFSLNINEKKKLKQTMLYKKA